MKLSKHSLEIINQLKSQNLMVKNKRKFIKFLADYGVVRVLNGYLSFLKDKNQIVCDGLDDRQLINFVLLDRKVANLISSAIMLFEQQFVTVVVQEFIKNNNLTSQYIFDVRTDNFVEFNDRYIYDSLADHMFTYVRNCNLLNVAFQYNNYSEIPLLTLSMSWSLNTSINFYKACSVNVKQAVLEYFGLQHLNFQQFIDILHIIRHFRNAISHNDVVIANNYKDQNDGFCLANNKLPTKIVGIYDVILFFEKTLQNNFNLIPKNLTKQLRKLVRKQRFSKSVLVWISNLMNMDNI